MAYHLSMKGLTESLDEGLCSQIKREEAEKNKYPLRPSSAGFCQTRLAFELEEYIAKKKYIKSPLEPRIFRIFSLGHSVEADVIKLCKSAGMRLAYEQQVVTIFRLESGSLIEGAIDFTLESDRELIVVDVKSVGDNFHSSFSTKWKRMLREYERMATVEKVDDESFYIDDLPMFLDELQDPFLANNMKQLNLYATTDFFRDRGVVHASLFRYNKNNSTLMELRFKTSLEVRNEIYDKFNRIEKAMEQDGAASVRNDFALGSMTCAFCDFGKKCKGVDTKQAWWDTLPPKNWATELESHPQIQKKFEEWEQYLDLDNKKARCSDELLLMLENEKLKKVKLANGNVYYLKYLKSPRPHFVIRQGRE